MSDRESFLKEPWDFRVVMDAYEVVAYLSSIEREVTAHGAARNIDLFRTHPRLKAKREQLKVSTIVQL